MQSRIISAALSVGLAAGLTGCVAAVIPAAAGGFIGKKAADRRSSAIPAPQDDTDRVSVGVVNGPLPIPTALLDAGKMEADRPYSGNLPAPSEPALALPFAASPSRAPTGWNDVVRYLADASFQPKRNSVLLAGGNDADHPRWISCGDKPRAIIVDLDLVLATDASEGLNAIETMGLMTVYTAKHPINAAIQKARKFRGGMRPPVAGNTLFSAIMGREEATRSAISNRYCVVAIVGSSAADFPNGIMPGNSADSSGWFLIQPR